MEAKPLIGKTLGIICIIASFVGLTCFASGIAALWQMGALPWLFRSKAGFILLGFQFGFAVGTAFFIDASRSCFRGWWRRAFINSLLGFVIVSALLYSLGAMKRMA